MNDADIRHWMGDFHPYVDDYDKEKAYDGKMPYLGLKNVEEIYVKLKGSKKGFSSFEKQAKHIGEKKNGSYRFTNEEGLFDVFKDHLGPELEARKIHSFGELMQFDS